MAFGSTTFTLYPPTSTFNVSNTGSTQLLNGYPTLIKLKGAGNANGIEITSGVTTNMPADVPPAEGKWTVAQVATLNRERTISEGYGDDWHVFLESLFANGPVNGIAALDGGFPAPAWLGEPYPYYLEFQTGQVTHVMFDTPGDQVGVVNLGGIVATIDTLRISDEFTDYLMFKPPGADSKWVPLAL